MNKKYKLISRNADSRAVDSGGCGGTETLPSECRPNVGSKRQSRNKEGGAAGLEVVTPASRQTHFVGPGCERAENLRQALRGQKPRPTGKPAKSSAPLLAESSVLKLLSIIGYVGASDRAIEALSAPASRARDRPADAGSPIGPKGSVRSRASRALFAARPGMRPGSDSRSMAGASAFPWEKKLVQAAREATETFQR